MMRRGSGNSNGQGKRKREKRQRDQEQGREKASCSILVRPARVRYEHFMDSAVDDSPGL